MRQLFKSIKDRFTPEPALPHQAVAELASDRNGLPDSDPGCQAVIDASLAWLCAAQDNSASADGGVARDFSLLKGWATSYPETTGYIIPTVIDLARRRQDDALHARARRMLDWCVAIQFPEGGFQGGKIDSTPKVPVTFNTGQILIGLAAGARHYGEDRYLQAMHRAAGWLRDTQDADGCWRKHPTPFAQPGEKAYETHVSWGLFEAERVAPGHGYGDAGLRQVDWALTKQRANGWFASNCLSDPAHPLTHTIGYVLRGVLEGHLLSGRPALLAAALRTADSLLDAIADDGYLAARLDSEFRAAADFVCLTGSVQIAHCLFILYQLTGEQRYLDAGRRLTAFVRRTVWLDGPRETRGGVKGSFPINGAYGQWEYLNWAAKFCIDANLLELELSQPRHA
ncbi:hypothetical protein [Duganella callida]|uniref:Squalene cyclase C-terminal domain-containing protein n=1 Tax=Duganella callida TaxID=2561932 RepID=A0A4Y9SY72_9BURK|nr:hypothetical protein [Duganella callida]TFW30164.1 hypothetical protein E4L98_02590 [Duganella callida]